MLLSKSCEYGLRATLYLAGLREEGYVSIRRISGDLGISFHFLTKVFQKLTEAGLMQSMRGPSGGVALARPASQIRILDVVLALDGPQLFTECVLGLPGCGNRQPCPLHDRWAGQREQLHALFSSTTVAELAEDVGAGAVRLKDLGGAGDAPDRT